MQSCFYIVQDTQLLEKTDILKRSRNPCFTDLNIPFTGNIFSVKYHLSCIRLINSGQKVKYGRLSCTIWSDQTIKLFFLNRKIKFIYSTETTERDSQILYIQQDTHSYSTSFAFFPKLKCFFLQSLSFSRHSIAFGDQLKSIMTISTIA